MIRKLFKWTGIVVLAVVLLVGSFAAHDMISY